MAKSLSISERGEIMPASPIRKLAPFADAAKAKGKKIYHLNIGQPDIETPKEMWEAIEEMAKKKPILEYGPSQGLPAFVNAWVEYYHGVGIDIKPEDLIVTVGGSEAIQLAMLAVMDPGDEMLTFEPFYANYNGFAVQAGVKVVAVTTYAENGFHLPPREEIEKKITDRTKVIMISNPGNPTGLIYTKEELDMLADIAKKHNLFIFSDEVYREFSYDDEKPISVLNIPGLEQHAIMMDSISKRYSACGARLGCVVSRNKEVMATIMKFAQCRLCAATLEQYGAVAAAKVPQSYLAAINAEYKKRRDTIYEKLMEIPGVICEKPKGAFYIVVKFPIDDAENFVRWMLTDFDDNGETVMMAPAAGFYATPGLGLNEARIAYILNVDDLKRAGEILKKGIAAYRKTVMGLSE